jgi:hypothetical protein
MTTLLAKFLAKPTAANAAKIAYYHRKHMMAECLLAGDYLALGILAEALEMFSIVDFTKNGE